MNWIWNVRVRFTCHVLNLKYLITCYISDLASQEYGKEETWRSSHDSWEFRLAESSFDIFFMYHGSFLDWLRMFRLLKRLFCQVISWLFSPQLPNIKRLCFLESRFSFLILQSICYHFLSGVWWLYEFLCCVMHTFLWYILYIFLCFIVNAFLQCVLYVFLCCAIYVFCVKWSAFVYVMSVCPWLYSYGYLVPYTVYVSAFCNQSAITIF